MITKLTFECFRKKKRRWDDAAPVEADKPDQTVEAVTARLTESVQQMVRTVMRLFMNLLIRVMQDPSIPQIFEKDIDINSSPARSFLTKGQAQKDVRLI